jgi:flagellar motor switch protein FliN/FliY
MSPTVSTIELPALVETKEKGAALGDRLDLVEHVKVKVSVTLGGTEISLGKLLSLSAGDVLPLDRDVDAPVDVRLHGKLIARGHLVAVGDRFGVSLTEIVSD